MGILLSAVTAAVITFIPYLVMLICHIKIFKYFKHHENSLSPVSKRVQTDLNRTLLAQAIIPISSAFLPMVIHSVSILSNSDFVFASFFSSMLYSWIPAGNAISILIFITAYRQMLKQLVLRSKSRLFRMLSIPSKVATTPS